MAFKSRCHSCLTLWYVYIFYILLNLFSSWICIKYVPLDVLQPSIDKSWIICLMYSRILKTNNISDEIEDFSINKLEEQIGIMKIVGFTVHVIYLLFIILNIVLVSKPLIMALWMANFMYYLFLSYRNDQIMSLPMLVWADQKIEIRLISNLRCSHQYLFR